jgi:hypothetical protein
MKKLILASCLLCMSTPIVFADDVTATETCTFNLTFNNVWNTPEFKKWIVTVVDVSNPAIKEAVGGTFLWRGLPVLDSPGVAIVVPNCTPQTQLAIFGHTPGPREGATEVAATGNLKAFASNFITGMSKCRSQLTPSEGTTVYNLTVGNPSLPGDFYFGPPGGSTSNYWTKADLNVVCPPSSESADQGY